MSHHPDFSGSEINRINSSIEPKPRLPAGKRQPFKVVIPLAVKEQ